MVITSLASRVGELLREFVHRAERIECGADRAQREHGMEGDGELGEVRAHERDDIPLADAARVETCRRTTDAADHLQVGVRAPGRGARDGGAFGPLRRLLEQVVGEGDRRDLDVRIRTVRWRWRMSGG
ncbi:MAG: hypothetical protein U5L05_18115 [Rubrivivax sp.]|nr:hypothetical protein [Rubrivivax sp.]